MFSIKSNKTHKDYNIGDMFIWEQNKVDGQYEKSIWYISGKKQYRKGCHYQFELVRLDKQQQWPLYYDTTRLNNLIIYSGYRHIPVSK